jgi:hypothetical protein
VEKLEELAYKAHFRGRSHFGDFGSKNFQSSFKASNTPFGVKNLQDYLLLLNIFLHTIKFPMMQKSPQSEFLGGIYTSHKLTYHIDHHGAKWMPPPTPITKTCGASHMWTFKKILEGPKP